MAVKRRIVWFSDEEWVALQAIAKDRGESVSGTLRQFWKATADLQEWNARRSTAPLPGPSLAIQQAERDAILRRVNRKGSGA